MRHRDRTDIYGNTVGHQPSSVPRVRDLYWPTLLALRSFGGLPATKSEVMAWVADHLRLPGSVVRLLHREDGSSPETELGYRITWALSGLKKIDTAHNPVRAHWVVTDFGRNIRDEQQLQELNDAFRRQHRVHRRAPASRNTRDWVLASMRMLVAAGVAEPSLDQIEYAAKAVGNPDDALVQCVKRLSDVVEELRDAVDGLAGR